jgi:NAD(P)-dependent dehydrogenase (short-subunit alcohol dehydrogenase family)
MAMSSISPTSSDIWKVFLSHKCRGDFMDLGLAGKVALITGASKGIGAASARVLAAEGAVLALAARSKAGLSALADELTQAHGVPASFWAGDLRDAEAAGQAVDAAIAAHGRIDILVVSAGASQGGLFWDIPDRVWEDSLALKFMATIRTLRAVIPVMRVQRSGRIVVVAGNTGRQPAPRLLPGAAANAALLAVVKGLADEVAADGIVINAVNPGPTRTERWTGLMDAAAAARGVEADTVEQDYIRDIPMRRLGEPDEIARLIAFLASPVAGNITGTSVTADGGWTRASA